MVMADGLLRLNVNLRMTTNQAVSDQSKEELHEPLKDNLMWQPKWRELARKGAAALSGRTP